MADQLDVDRLVGEDVGEPVSMRKVATASFIGTTIEWYDFLLYGTLAALVFNELFFPALDPLLGTLAALSTFSIGFISRPIGAVVFGHYGDRIGRKGMLIVTLLLMGVATFLIGLLPTYATIGVWAPIALVVLRFVQGFGLGGEWGGAALMTVEHAPAERRGFYGSWPQMGSPLGAALAPATVVILTSTLTEEQFLAFGWRIPFLLSALLVAVGLFIRMRIVETPAFSRVRETHTEARLPIVETLRDYPKSVALVLCMHLANTSIFYLNTVFIVSYATETLKLSQGVVLGGIVLSQAIFVFIGPLIGALSDRVGRRPVYLAGTIGMALVAFPYFWLADTRVPALLWLAIVMTMLPNALMYSIQSAFFAELFGTRVRYSGMSLGVQGATVIGGATAPLVATALLGLSGGEPWSVAAYMALIALIASVATWVASEGSLEEADGALAQSLGPAPRVGVSPTR